jgi:hypothetical protein
LRVTFIEDIPARPRNAIVSTVEVEYKYTIDVPAPPIEEFRTLLIDKYGAPDKEKQDRHQSSEMLWGSAACFGESDCADGPYLSAKLIYLLRLGDSSRWKAYMKASQDAYDAAAPSVRPKF